MPENPKHRVIHNLIGRMRKEITGLVDDDEIRVFKENWDGRQGIELLFWAAKIRDLNFLTCSHFGVWLGGTVPFQNPRFFQYSPDLAARVAEESLGEKPVDAVAVEFFIDFKGDPNPTFSPATSQRFVWAIAPR